MPTHSFDCPYCATTAAHTAEPFEPAVITCPICNGRFVAEIKVSYTPLVKRIEGEVARLRCACIREVA